MPGSVRQYLWRQKIHRGLKKHTDRWKVFVDGEFWLCPYCANTAFRAASEASLAEQILEHFINVCPEWDSAKGKQKTPAILKERAERLTLRNRLLRRPSWRLFDFENRWYCPFCSNPTEVRRPLGDKPTEETLEEVERHLRSCHMAQKPLPREIPLGDLRQAVQESNRFRGLVASIRAQLETGNDLYKQHDDHRLWVCPYCACVVEDVRLEDSALVLSVVPSQMAQHLIKQCPQFREDQQLTRDLDELKRMVKDIREGRRARGTVTELRQNLAATQAQLKTQSSELERAKDVQQSILPKTTPRIAGYEIGCAYRPATHLGGDFYAFIDVDHVHTGFLMADVSGHGADAALVMSMTKKAFDLRGPTSVSPADVLRQINQDVYMDLRGKHFVTAFYMVLNARDHAIHYSRAGHNYPFLFNSAREPSIAVLKSKGSALGFGPSQVFDRGVEERELGLQTGDLILIYTDGLVEAKNAKQEEFDLPRVCDVLKRHTEGSLDTLLERLMKSVDEFTGGQEQEDDIALLAVRYTG